MGRPKEEIKICKKCGSDKIDSERAFDDEWFYCWNCRARTNKKKPVWPNQI